jgi:NADH:ubiquinone reductase (non-electrogenic)
MWPRGTRPRVTLIDRGDRFVFKPLLYELLNGGASADEVAPRFDRLLASTRVAFIRGAVDRVEEGVPSASSPAGAPFTTTTTTAGGGGGTVVLSDGTAVEYDWLVLALGGETTTFGVPGAADLALPFCTYEDAVEVDARLTELEARVAASGRAEAGDGVVVVGAGYAGVELAATVAERLAASLGARGLPVPAVTIVTYSDDILDGAQPGQRAAAAAQLATSGVAVRTRAAVSRVTAGSTAARTVHLRGTAGSPDSREATASRDAALDAGLVLWTAGTGPVTRSDGGGPSLPFPRSPRGAIRVEPTLRIVGHPRAFALGDVAGVEAALNAGDSGERDSAAAAAVPPLAPTAQVAFQQADYAAWNVWSSINARRLLPFRYQHLGEMMSLGKRAGAVTLPVPVPAGLAAAVAKSPLGGLLGAVGVRLPTEPDAPASGLTLEGPLAGALRRAAYWYRQPTGGQRVSVGREWLQAAAGEVAGAVRRRQGGGGKGGE